MKLSTAASLLLAGTACANTQILSHRVVDEGQFSAISGRRYEVVENEQDWTALWFEHRGLESERNDVPRIDFEKEMIVATFMGSQTTYGNRIYLDLVAADDTRCAVKVGEAIIQRGARVYCAPFQFSAISRTDLPVRFLDQEHPFESLDSGLDSHQSKPAEFVVRDEKEWSEIWGLTFNKSLAPYVDFENEMVLAVFLGNQPSNGHSVRIADLSESELNDTTVLVPIFMHHHTPNKARLPIVTSPYHFVVTPASDLPVRFERVEF